MTFNLGVCMSNTAIYQLASVALLTLVLSACGSDSADTDTPFQPRLDMIETMNWVLDPAADVIWANAGWEITAEGEKELWPTTEEGWNDLIHASATVSEAGNLLMIPGRVEGPDGRGEDWNAYAQALVETGQQLLKASQERDKQAIFDLGGQLYRVCVACHTHYAYPEETN